MKFNRTDHPILDGEYEEPIAPGHVRIYEFLHGYEDKPIAEIEKSESDPLMKVLNEETQKEIDKEVIRMICKKATEF